jgi:AcrR family transcriptional regulator
VPATRAQRSAASQHRAEVSRGRLLDHFPSRTALLVAAADHLVETRFGLDGPVPAAAPGGAAGPEGRLDRAADAMWRTFHQPYFWAAMEL